MIQSDDELSSEQSKNDFDYQDEDKSSASSKDNVTRLIVTTTSSATRVGDMLTVTCTSNRPVKLSWYKIEESGSNSTGGEPLTTIFSRRVVYAKRTLVENVEAVQFGDYTLLNMQFKSLTRKDQGMYECSAGAESDKETSATFKLVVFG
jgi:hypothetical protein